MENILIDIISGAIGGNAAGVADKKGNMGAVWNSVAGIAGGLLGGQLLDTLVANLVNTTLGGVLGSAACGAIAVYLVKFIKNLLNKKKATPTQ
ncbi:hypothetical protein SDC9_07957 [bioreactor metagenome]|uniref:Uncharacterized protein n=1 Tax=bioreactor metagenome TaxID=1076179 RepID=A0A644T605_9ZZZZ|nr:hypothetical protein [Candidatus Elulimicrobiales bacterium]